MALIASGSGSDVTMEQLDFDSFVSIVKETQDEVFQQKAVVQVTALCLCAVLSLHFGAFRRSSAALPRRSRGRSADIHATYTDCPPTKWPKSPRIGPVQEIFDILDPDGDGELAKHELMHFLELAGVDGAGSFEADIMLRSAHAFLKVRTLGTNDNESA